MALQTSGAISLLNIANEFGGSAPHSLSEYYGAASGIPSSGAISISQFYGKSAQTFHTSTAGGINAFFGGYSWSVPSDNNGSFTFYYSPGIPVSSSVKFFTENGGDKSMYCGINGSVFSSVGASYPVLSFSGLLTSIFVYYDTNDEGGDSFSFAVTNVDGSQNYTKVNSTTMSIPQSCLHKTSQLHLLSEPKCYDYQSQQRSEVLQGT